MSPVLKLFSFLQPKDSFDVEVHLDERTEKVEPPAPSEQVETAQPIEATPEQQRGTTFAIEHGQHNYRLQDLAYTRSGDKGNNCNIGVIARHPAYVPYLRAFLTEEAVAEFMKSSFDDPTRAKVTRYEVPGVNGFNFVLHNSLGGGGIASVRVDPQGKAYGQTLLNFKIENVPNLLELAEKFRTIESYA